MSMVTYTCLDCYAFWGTCVDDTCPECGGKNIQAECDE